MSGKKLSKNIVISDRALMESKKSKKPTNETKIHWSQKPLICNYCNKQMKNASKSRHLKSCMPKSLDKNEEFTDAEKQLIDKNFNAMMKKIQRKQIPYNKKLQKHFD